MATEDLKHARWLISQLVRDPQQRLAIAETAVHNVELRFQQMLDDEGQRDAFIDQVLRLAHGAYTEGGEVELARTLLKLIVSHPAGRERLEKSGPGRAWTKFVEQPLTAPSVEAREPPPQGSISIKSLVNRTGKFRP